MNVRWTYDAADALLRNFPGSKDQAWQFWRYLTSGYRI